jgi:hypothetical protein
MLGSSRESEIRVTEQATLPIGGTLPLNCLRDLVHRIADHGHVVARADIGDWICHSLILSQFG